jgi:hypothetical protein
MFAQFDIFQGEPGKSNMMWIAAVESLEVAHDRLLALATERPGKYFVFRVRTCETVSKIDTSGRPLSKSA